MLTGRRSEYKGTRENNEYELYLAIEEMDHAFTKAKSRKQMVFVRDFINTIQQ